MEHLRADYTEVWGAGQNRPLIRFADAVDSIAATSIDLAGIPGVELPTHLLRRLRSFDEIVSWYGSSRPDFRGWAAELGLPFRFLPALPEDVRGQHAADFFLEQARGLTGGVIVHPACPTLRIERTRPDATFAVVHPFSGSKRKNWPLERYHELAERLQAELPVFWCAGPEEPLDGAIRFDDLYELACWIAGASVYIGNDSGISHLAAAAGAPVLALFGPTDPAVWAPLGAAVRIVSTPSPGMSIEAIMVEEVLDAVRGLLSARTQRRSE